MFRNTGEEVPMLVGNIVAITAGAAISLGVSLVTRGAMTRDMEDREWELTRWGLGSRNECSRSFTITYKAFNQEKALLGDCKCLSNVCLKL